MIFVLDASTLVAFYAENELDEPELLHSLKSDGHQLIIPRAVFEEIEKGRKPTYLILSKAVRDNVVTVNDEISDEETDQFGKRHPRLHVGELQVMLLGLKLKANGETQFYCLIDEEPGKTIAERNGIPVKGTRGLINLLNKIGIIEKTRMETLLYRLDHCNFRS